MPDEAMKISREQANQAFNTTVQAVSAAMAGKFPIGIDHVEIHMEIKAALQTLGAALKEYYGEPMAASDAATQPVTSESAVTEEPTND